MICLNSFLLILLISPFVICQSDKEIDGEEEEMLNTMSKMLCNITLSSGLAERVKVCETALTNTVSKKLVFNISVK